MCTFFRIKLLCQFMRIEYLSHMRYPKEISILLPLMTQMFSDDIHLGYTIKDSGTSRPLTNSAPDKLGP